MEIYCCYSICWLIRSTMDIYICHKEEVFIKNTHVSSEFFKTTYGVGGPNKDSTNKVGEGLNAPFDELEDEFGLSNEEEDFDEDLDKDDVEPTIYNEVEDDENIDLSGDEDGYGSDAHELNIVKTDLKAYIKKVH
ncbi:hypothetical protein HAX54_016353 [Datura stramonium]|uniref:Uncharacterized protein n=1 Tax=Datura stramonium TaxID=4076 RepID=A0ABS8Y459_DATST|nr:hypothetical protein [Datura stramonium]